MTNVEIRESWLQPLLILQERVDYNQIENEDEEQEEVEQNEVEHEDEEQEVEHEVDEQEVEQNDEQEENQQEEIEHDEDEQPLQVQQELSTPFRVHRANSFCVLICVITLQIANVVLFISSKLSFASSDISFYVFIGLKCLILVLYTYMALKGFRKNVVVVVVLFESTSCIFWLMFCNYMAAIFYIVATGLLHGICLTLDLLILHHGNPIQSNQLLQEGRSLWYEYVPFTWTSDTDNNQQVCSVCLESIQNGVRLRCLHTYHKVCIDTWLAKSDVCPMCRSTV
jgi:hypothetical protein